MGILVPLARPTVGSAGKTGIWRALRPVVDPGKCTGCLLCALYCPEGAIDVVDRRPAIDYDYCKGCGICANECPSKAISMVRE